MARTAKTLSLSLPPGVVEELAKIGKPTGRTGARVAAEIVLREIAKIPKPKEETRRLSWCCQAARSCCPRRTPVIAAGSR